MITTFFFFPWPILIIKVIVVTYFLGVGFFFSLGVTMFCLIYSMAEFETLHFMFLWLNFPLVFFSLGWCIFIAIFFVQCLNFSYLISSLGRCISMAYSFVEWLNSSYLISSLGNAFLSLIFLFNGWISQWWFLPWMMHFYGWFLSAMALLFSIDGSILRCYISKVDFCVQWVNFQSWILF